MTFDPSLQDSQGVRQAAGNADSAEPGAPARYEHATTVARRESCEDPRAICGPDGYSLEEHWQQQQ